MKTVLNYTNRNDSITFSGANPEVEIKVIDKNNLTLFSPKIRIKDNKFPEDSLIYIQAYSIDGYVGEPINYGTIKEPKDIFIEEPHASPDQIRFRFKIIENTKNKLKKVLSINDGIKPWSPGKETLLNVGEGKIDSIYEIEVTPNDVPSIIFRSGLGIKADLKNSNYLKGIIFTAALREILLRYIIESERFSDCKIKKEYEKHFIELTSEEFPIKFENSDNKITEWIKRAVARFSDHEIKKNKSLIAIMPSSEVNIAEKLTYKK
jgi:hypothetical protein